MKAISQIILLLCLILLGNHTPTKAGETEKPICGFIETMTLIDKYSGSQDVLEKASECLENMDSDDPLTYLIKGRIIIKSGTSSNGLFSEDAISAAQKHYEKAIKLAPDNYEVNFYAALFYGTATNGANDKTAQKHLEKLSKIAPDSESTLYMKMILLPDGAPEKEKLANQLSGSPVFIHKHMALVVLRDVYWKTDYNMVETVYQELIKNGKKHNLNLGWDYGDYARFLIYQKRDFKKGREILEVSRSYMKYGMQDSYESDISYLQGYQYVWKTNPRDYGKAIPLLEESIRVYSNHKYAYYNLAIAYYYHGMDTENEKLIYKAKEAMLLAKEKKPSYGEIEKNLARINNTISQIERP